MDKAYPIQWRDPRLNLTELAKLRWIEGMDTNSLAKHFKTSPYTIKNHIGTFDDLIISWMV